MELEFFAQECRVVRHHHHFHHPWEATVSIFHLIFLHLLFHFIYIFLWKYVLLECISTLTEDGHAFTGNTLLWLTIEIQSEWRHLWWVINQFFRSSALNYTIHTWSMMIRLRNEMFRLFFVVVVVAQCTYFIDKNYFWFCWRIVLAKSERLSSNGILIWTRFNSSASSLSENELSDESESLSLDVDFVLCLTFSLSFLLLSNDCISFSDDRSRPDNNASAFGNSYREINERIEFNLIHIIFRTR